jgi:arylsulfatase A-like enzyme
VDGATRGGRPFFALYMPIAGHHPYRAPGDLPRPLPERTPLDAYRNDLHVGDLALGALREGLRARGLDQRTIYFVVGDHGEAFGEHEGNVAHAMFLYEENVRIPFFVAAPGRLRGVRRAPQLASLLDLAPTTLALAGLRDDGHREGRSLLPATARLQRFTTDQGVSQSGLRDGRWKLVRDLESGRTELYDLARDPAERSDLATRDPARVAHYASCLAR